MVPMVVNVTEVQRKNLNAITVYDRLPTRPNGLSVNWSDATDFEIPLFAADRFSGQPNAAKLRISEMLPYQPRWKGRHGASAS